MSTPRRWYPRFALASVAALVFAACGSNAGTPSNDAGVVPADADLGVDAVSCAALPCLANATSLVAFCAPSGTCTAQVTVSGGIATMTKCFANGVKIQVTATNAGSGGTNTVMSVKKDGAGCYSFAAMGTANAQVGTAPGHLLRRRPVRFAGVISLHERELPLGNLHILI